LANIGRAEAARAAGWPTLVTLAMFPILVFMYGRLARNEERDMLAEFGDEYRRYLNAVPAFFPDLFPLDTKGDSP
jgi:protein-S-isoprenylcysteine O-methyltransferase Ste14